MAMQINRRDVRQELQLENTNFVCLSAQHPRTSTDELLGGIRRLTTRLHKLGQLLRWRHVMLGSWLALNLCATLECSVLHHAYGSDVEVEVNINARRFVQ